MGWAGVAEPSPPPTSYTFGYEENPFKCFLLFYIRNPSKIYSFCKQRREFYIRNPLKIFSEQEIIFSKLSPRGREPKSWRPFFKNLLFEGVFENSWGKSLTPPKFNTHKKNVLHFFKLLL